MPKEKRTRIGGHQPSVKIPKRSFAVQENAVEHVEVGSAPDAPANEILQSLESGDEESWTPTTKKEKLAMKRQAFLQKLNISKSPYSKSHNRRLKRRAKEQIATGMSDIQDALAALEEPLDNTDEAWPSQKGKDTMDPSKPGPSKAPASSKSFKIGEGRPATLSKSQRKKVLELERSRQPLILTNSTFASNPFSTIRVHAQNTLVKHKPT